MATTTRPVGRPKGAKSVAVRTSPTEEAAMYDLRQVATLLGISYGAAWAMAADGRLPFDGVQFGRRWRFRKADVDHWLHTDVVPGDDAA